MNLRELDCHLNPLLELAIKEDIGHGDITTEAILSASLKGKVSSVVKGQIIAKSKAILCGLPMVDYVFNYQTDAVKNSKFFFSEGASVKNGDIVYGITGSMSRLLSFERIALNILQKLSGIASKTKEFVLALEGKTKLQILDTRKTAPGYRALEKYAVKTGGGTNHRSGLYDMFMIKDNHIKLAGGVTQSIKSVRLYASERDISNLKIEVECKSLEQVREAVEECVDIIMLDNMPDSSLRQSINMIPSGIKVEVSGNITLGKIPVLAKLDVDFVSVGALTHSVAAKDFSMNIEPLSVVD